MYKEGDFSISNKDIILFGDVFDWLSKLTFVVWLFESAFLRLLLVMVFVILSLIISIKYTSLVSNILTT